MPIKTKCSNAILKLPARLFEAVSKQITNCIQCLLITCQKQIFESPKLYEARTRSSGEKDRAVTWDEWADTICKEWEFNSYTHWKNCRVDISPEDMLVGISRDNWMTITILLTPLLVSYELQGNVLWNPAFYDISLWSVRKSSLGWGSQWYATNYRGKNTDLSFRTRSNDVPQKAREKTQTAVKSPTTKNEDHRLSFCKVSSSLWLQPEKCCRQF